MNKRENWSESEIDQLPQGEHDYFERKSGLLLTNHKGQFLEALAKAISAFANSGGGHLILGVNDTGVPDGLPPVEGRTSIRDWIEQIIPNLVAYPLSDFRVHRVIRGNPSRIPPDKEVIVVDVGDSALAPHQSTRDKIYYYRSAGRSELAPHFYLELLRQRLVNPVLDLSLEELLLEDAYQTNWGDFLETKLKFRITNTGRVAAYKWALLLRSISQFAANRQEDYIFNTADYPIKKSRSSSFRTDDTILPGCSLIEYKNLGVFLRPSRPTPSGWEAEIKNMILKLTIAYQLATETSPGNLQQISLANIARPYDVADFVLLRLRENELNPQQGA
jgi:hypothetical protein